MNSRTAPVSGLQRGLWFLDRWNPGAATYTVPLVLEFDGPVDVGLLKRCLAEIVRRHETLRTTFALGADGPQQVVHEPGPVPFTSTDLSELPPAQQQAALAELLDAGARTGVDLEAGPLLQARVVAGSAVPTTLLVLIHHIVWDGWSEGVFERELAELYSALAAGRAPVLPELTVQYADHARDERAQDYREHLAYWRDRLRGAPAELDLTGGCAHPATRTPAGGTLHFDLPSGLSAKVQKLASAADATPFVVQLAAFAMLLNRYTGADDLVIGTPVTTRGRPELEHLIGYFVNIVPLRIRVRRDATFRELVAEVADTAFAAYAYLDVPFDLVVDAVGAQRSARNLPLVQVVFGAHTQDRAPLRFGPASGGRRTHHNGTSKFDLTWSTFDDGELRGEVEYSTDLFSRAAALRLAAHWRTLLVAAVDHPDQPLWRLGRPHDADRPAGLARLEAVPVRCLHSIFEAAADRFPQRPAVTSGAGTLTYAELDARANRLANALIAAGIQHGDRVGLLLERTAHVVVAILAVLKAGAAYVPVDLAAPSERGAFVFGDTGVRLVITDQGPDGPWPTFSLTEQADLVAAQPATRPNLPVRPADLAYLIFTSGSTGRPKGVAVAHEHVSRLMATGAEHFGFTEGDVWTLFHSYAFDWTVWELWGALHHGGRLIVVPRMVSRAPEEFAELLAAERVSCLCLTPSALRQLEATLRAAPRALPALRHVMLGGEALDPAVVRRWFALSPRPPAAMCNLYGITETTVHVTTHDLAGSDGFDRSLIGEAMPHLAALVLDERLQPCPVGVAGELYVAGGGLAYGYWGRPGLTAQRFLPHPAGRLYRTGDLARRLPGGGLEYLGRCDNQVKIRGFRIELGEIENAVCAHPAVAGCVVTVHEPSTHDRSLAAYVTVVPGEAPDYQRLREFLARSLPDYMIPATVTVLDAIPMTVNGKVDRAALPAPGRPTPAGEAGGYVAPGTPGERLLAEAFGEVLGVPEVAAGDNFFHLGGDSIRAVYLAGQLRDRGWTLSLRDLFAAPTPAGLAPSLRPCTAARPALAAFELISGAARAALPDSILDAYPMVSMQLSMIFHMELSGDACGYHNVNSYRVSGPFDEQALRTAVAEVMRRHPVLRTSLDVSSYGQPLQLVHADLAAPVEVADLRGQRAGPAHRGGGRVRRPLRGPVRRAHATAVPDHRAAAGRRRIPAHRRRAPRHPGRLELHLDAGRNPGTARCAHRRPAPSCRSAAGVHVPRLRGRRAGGRLVRRGHGVLAGPAGRRQRRAVADRIRGRCRGDPAYQRARAAERR